ATDALTEYLRPRQMLLVLDNCEHLIDTAAQLVDRLLRSCPHVRIIATSREVLGVPGEATWRVAPLAGVDPARCDARASGRPASRQCGRRSTGATSCCLPRSRLCFADSPYSRAAGRLKPRRRWAPARTDDRTTCWSC